MSKIYEALRDIDSNRGRKVPEGSFQESNEENTHDGTPPVHRVNGLDQRQDIGSYPQKPKGGNMKNQLPIWIFLIVLIIVVLFIFNYQGGRDLIPLSEIFPDKEIKDISEVEYVFMDSPPAESVSQEELKVAPKAPERMRKVLPPAAQETIRQEAITIKPDFSQVPYTIQVASFREKTSAESVLKKVIASGLPGHLVSVDLGQKGIWYRIYIGSFQTKDQADQFLQKVRGTYKDSFIIRPK